MGEPAALSSAAGRPKRSLAIRRRALHLAELERGAERGRAAGRLQEAGHELLQLRRPTQFWEWAPPPEAIENRQ